jgi:NADH-quinone oxidoreductase subunit N
VLLFAVAIQVGYGWLAIVAAVNTVISIFYYVRVLAPSYFGEPPASVAVLGPPAAWATFAAAAAVIVTGVVAEPFVRAFVESGLLIR